MPQVWRADDAEALAGLANGAGCPGTDAARGAAPLSYCAPRIDIAAIRAVPSPPIEMTKSFPVTSFTVTASRSTACQRASLERSEGCVPRRALQKTNAAEPIQRYTECVLTVKAMPLCRANACERGEEDLCRRHSASEGVPGTKQLCIASTHIERIDRLHVTLVPEAAGVGVSARRLGWRADKMAKNTHLARSLSHLTEANTSPASFLAIYCSIGDARQRVRHRSDACICMLESMSRACWYAVFLITTKTFFI